MPSIVTYGRSAGVWQGYDGGRDGAEAVIESNAVEQAAVRSIKIIALSATTIAAVYITRPVGSDLLRLAIGTISGSTITWGTPISVQATGYTYHFDVDAISATKLLIGYITSSGADGFLKSYTISGTTPTLDATETYTLSGNANSRVAVAALSATRAIYARADDTAQEVRGLTIGSGTLAKDGSASTVGAEMATARAPALSRVSSTTALLAFCDGSNKMKACMLSDSGSAISANARVFLTAGAADEPTVQNDFMGLAHDGIGTGIAMMSRTGTTAPGCVGAPFSWSGTTLTSPLDSSYADDALRAPFHTTDIAYMQTWQGKLQFLAGFGNWLTKRARIGSIIVPSITTPYFGGVKDSFGYTFSSGNPPECGISVARLSDSLAVAAYLTATNRYPAAIVLNP